MLDHYLKLVGDPLHCLLLFFHEVISAVVDILMLCYCCLDMSR